MGNRLLALLVGAIIMVPGSASAADVEFNNYCTLGSFRVCSSVHVFVAGDGKTVTMRFWNMERNDSPLDTYGEKGTFTAVGLYHSNPAYAFAGSASLESVTYDGTDVSSFWGGKGKSIGNLAGVKIELVAGTDRGHHGGIVGCTDPGGNVTHFSTCGSFPDQPYLEFVFTTDEVFRTESLQYRAHAQQVGNGQSVKCDSFVTTGDNAGCMPGDVVPEPITTVLLGSGLLGVAGAGIRRRRRGLDVVNG